MLLSFLENKRTFRPDFFEYASLDRYDFEKHSVTVLSGEVEFYFKKKESPTVILFFHGNTGNVTFTEKYYPVFEALGTSYVLVEYPGYGTAAGTPSEEALYESARAAFAFLSAQGFFR